MFGLDLRSPHRLATSSGSVNLNSPFVPSHVIQFALLESDSNSNKNCHNCICPEPLRTVEEENKYKYNDTSVSETWSAPIAGVSIAAYPSHEQEI